MLGVHVLAGSTPASQTTEGELGRAELRLEAGWHVANRVSFEYSTFRPLEGAPNGGQPALKPGAMLCVGGSIPSPSAPGR